jgi:hypothetical protein
MGSTGLERGDIEEVVDDARHPHRRLSDRGDGP